MKQSQNDSIVPAIRELERVYDLIAKRHQFKALANEGGRGKR